MATSPFREYFLLTDALAAARQLPKDQRDALARTLSLGRQRAEAADALWSNGHTAEGLRLGADAFEQTLTAAGSFASARQIEPVKPAPAKIEPAKIEPKPVEAPKAEEAPKEETAKADAEDGDAKEETATADAKDGDAKDDDAKDDDAKDDDAKEATATADAKDGDAKEETAKADAKDDDELEASTEGAKDAPKDDAAPSPKEAAASASPPSSSIPVTTPTAAAVEPPWATALRSRGLSERRVRTVQETDTALRRTELPALDDEVSPAHADLFQQLVTSRRFMDGALGPAAMTTGQITWTRLSRWGVVVAAMGILGLGAWWFLHTPSGVTATASGVYANLPDFQPEKTVDGNPDTEWLLPDRTTGWLELRIAPAEHIGTLRIRNGHNPPYNDRATREYTIEVYSHGALARTIQGNFPSLQVNPPWAEHAINVDDVDRIRYVVRSYHNLGSAVAEIEWE